MSMSDVDDTREVLCRMEDIMVLDICGVLVDSGFSYSDSRRTLTDSAYARRQSISTSNARHALPDKDRPRIAHGSRLGVIQLGGRRRDAALLVLVRIEGSV